MQSLDHDILLDLERAQHFIYLFIKTCNTYLYKILYKSIDTKLTFFFLNK